MPSPAVHPRLTWAVDALDACPADQVLEVGCGPGVAARLVADQVTKGHVTAIDRSYRAVERAAGEGAEQIAAGRLTIQRASLAELADEAVQQARYDLVFAVNVNLFWVQPGGAEAAVVRQLLRPNGTCLLFYAVPCTSMVSRTSKLASSALRNLGFVTERVPGPTPAFVGIRATIDAQVGASIDG